MAPEGSRLLGQLAVQFCTVLHLYSFVLSSAIACSRSFSNSSRLSEIHRQACSKAAGPRNSSGFHQYGGHEALQQAHRIHSYNPSSFLLSAGDCLNSRPSFGNLLVFNHGSIDLYIKGNACIRSLVFVFHIEQKIG